MAFSTLISFVLALLIVLTSNSLLLGQNSAAVKNPQKKRPAVVQDDEQQVDEKTIVEVTGDDAAELRHEDLDATLWIQTSGEYSAITRQAYYAAMMNLKSAKDDPDWTASIEQRKLDEANVIRVEELPIAVVLDVDETVLDNSSYQAGLIEEKKEYSREGWKDYCRTKRSTAVPGAVDFVEYCREQGVQILFVTNREKEVEPETRENLISVGLMKESDPDIIFSKYEKEEWKSDKINRRTELAEKYRILLLIGDDLHDFAPLSYHPDSEMRRKFVAKHSQMWGSRWIVLPNPNYGGWEQASYDWKNSSSSKTKLELKRKKLRR